MTIKKIYGSFVKKLPVNSKKKNWLLRNWVGGWIGFFTGVAFPFILYYLLKIENFICITANAASEGPTGGMVSSCTKYLIENSCSGYTISCMGYSPFMTALWYGLIIGFVGVFVGAFIQSLIRKMGK